VLLAGAGLTKLARVGGDEVHTDDGAQLEVTAGGEATAAGADHVTSIVSATGRSASLFAALGIERDEAASFFLAQARCLSKDAPDAARFVRGIGVELGGDPNAVTPPERLPVTTAHEAARALSSLGSGSAIDPDEALRIARALATLAVQGGPDATAATDLLERGFPAGVLYLTRAQLVLELALRAGDEERCARAAETIVRSRVLDLPLLAQAARCHHTEALDALTSAARRVSPRGIASE
jgi:hypothetical protein